MPLECPQCRKTLPDQPALEDAAAVECPVCGATMASSENFLGAGAASPRPLPAPPVPVRRKGFEPDGTERWFVLIGEEQCGPFDVAEMAKRLDSGAVDWTTAVWRDGLKDWRAARRDAVLITSIAGERGFASDTVRLNSAGSFVTQEDVTVERAPPDQETVRLPTRHPAVFDSGADWPAMSHDLAATLGGEEGDGASARPGAPSLSPATVFQIAGWRLRIPHSVVSVAAVSFATGVLAAALWSRFLGRGESFEWAAIAHSIVSGEEAAPAPVQRPGAAVLASERLAGATAHGPDKLLADEEVQVAAAPMAPPVELTVPSRELPRSQEIRDALRSVAPDVRDCLANPKLGADVVIYLDGPSGRVRDLRVRRPALKLTRIQCLDTAVRQLQIEPFRRSELVYPYKFAW